MAPLDTYLRKLIHDIAHKTFPAGAGLLAILGVSAPVSAASLSRSMDVKGTPEAIWSVIGPFCAIQDWLPPIGRCTEDGGLPPTRTLVTKDGGATFVETQTARNDEQHSYSYTFKSSPLPVAHYNATITVTAKGQGLSTVTWSSTYTPDVWKEHEVAETLGHVYLSGLTAIKVRFAE